MLSWQVWFCVCVKYSSMRYNKSANISFSVCKCSEILLLILSFKGIYSPSVYELSLSLVSVFKSWKQFSYLKLVHHQRQTNQISFPRIFPFLYKYELSTMKKKYCFVLTFIRGGMVEQWLDSSPYSNKVPQLIPELGMEPLCVVGVLSLCMCEIPLGAPVLHNPKACSACEIR